MGRGLVHSSAPKGGGTLFTRWLSLLTIALVLAGCRGRPAPSDPPRPRPEPSTPRGPTSADLRVESDPPKPPPDSRPDYLMIPLDINFPDVPEVPEEIKGPSPPIKDDAEKQ